MSRYGYVHPSVSQYGDLTNREITTGDTLGITASEAHSSSAQIFSEDTLVVTIVNSISTLKGTLNDFYEQPKIVLVEDEFISVNTTGSDPPVVTLNGVFTIRATVSGNDTCNIGVVESHILIDYTPIQDGLGISLNTTWVIEAENSSSDSGTTGINELTNHVVYISSDDTLTVGFSEDETTLNSQINSVESINLGLTDFTNNQYVTITTRDSAFLDVGEEEALFVYTTVENILTLGILNSAEIFANINNYDIINIVVENDGVLLTNSNVEDVIPPYLDENSGTYSTRTTGDNLMMGTFEMKVFTEPVPLNDNNLINIIEDSNLVVLNTGIDNLQTGEIDNSDLQESLIDSDDILLVIEEISNTTADIFAEEYEGIGLLENSELKVNILSSETVSLGFETNLNMVGNINGIDNTIIGFTDNVNTVSANINDNETTPILGEERSLRGDSIPFTELLPAPILTSTSLEANLSTSDYPRALVLQYTVNIEIIDTDGSLIGVEEITKQIDLSKIEELGVSIGDESSLIGYDHKGQPLVMGLEEDSNTICYICSSDTLELTNGTEYNDLIETRATYLAPTELSIGIDCETTIKRPVAFVDVSEQYREVDLSFKEQQADLEMVILEDNPQVYVNDEVREAIVEMEERKVILSYEFIGGDE